MKKLLLVLAGMLIISAQAIAAPHITGSIKEPQEKPGKTLKDRHADRIAAGAPGIFFAPLSSPSATISILFLRVDFVSQTTASTTGNGTWGDSVYSSGSLTVNDLNDPSNYWVKKSESNFIDYWKEVSYGMLNIEVSISDKVYRLPSPMAAYGAETNASIESFIFDSIRAAETDTISFPTFTVYDGILVVHAGQGEESEDGSTPNDLWSLYYPKAGICQGAVGGGGSNCLHTILKGGGEIAEAIIMPQTEASYLGSPLDPLGVYVHEFGHWLGLPDLYDTYNLYEGIGNWSLMAGGSWNKGADNHMGSSPAHLDAWSRVKLGWANPQVVTTYQTSMNLGSVESVPTPTIAAAGTNIIKAQASTSTAKQYYLLENRQNIGFDYGLPGHGMLVWLIDEDVITANMANNTVNGNSYHPGVMLIEADGDDSLFYSTNRGDAGDPFPGTSNNVTFTPITYPSSIPYTAYGSVNIRAISEITGTFGNVSFSLGFAPTPPQNASIDRTSKTLTWSASSGASLYNIYLNYASTRYAQVATTSYTDSALGYSDVYSITALDANGNESEATDVGPVGPPPAVDDGNHRHQWCFIATAAYGSSLDPHVETLRQFRDRHLLTNAVGRSFVDLYYQASPPMAEYISRHELLRTATRFALTPIVIMIEHPVILLLLSGLVIGVLIVRKRMACG